jgi:hypothetical protein
MFKPEHVASRDGNVWWARKATEDDSPCLL